MLAATRALIVRKKTMKCTFLREEDDSETGLFIIEVGKCSICNDQLGEGKKALFTEISRSTVFGEST